MEIVKSCNPDPNKPRTIKFIKIPSNMMFRYGSHQGLWIKVGSIGSLDLSSGSFYPSASESEFSSYVELPNAKIVTGEP